METNVTLTMTVPTIKAKAILAVLGTSTEETTTVQSKNTSGKSTAKPGGKIKKQAPEAEYEEDDLADKAANSYSEDEEGAYEDDDLAEDEEAEVESEEEAEEEISDEEVRAAMNKIASAQGTKNMDKFLMKTCKTKARPKVASMNEEHRKAVLKYAATIKPLAKKK